MPKDDEKPPAWFKTPMECDYRLVMYDGAGGARQEVEATRAEFVDLKKHLCDLRGIPIPESIGDE